VRKRESRIRNTCRQLKEKEPLTVMHCYIDFWRAKIILVAEPACVLVGVTNDRLGIKVNLNAADVLLVCLLRKLSKKDRYNE
jgi:hypothetical protein